jgi:hypothetical protein
MDRLGRRRPALAVRAGVAWKGASPYTSRGERRCVTITLMLRARQQGASSPMKPKGQKDGNDDADIQRETGGGGARAASRAEARREMGRRPWGAGRSTRFPEQLERNSVLAGCSMDFSAKN